jgi:hypothetical protein
MNNEQVEGSQRLIIGFEAGKSTLCVGRFSSRALGVLMGFYLLYFDF